MNDLIYMGADGNFYKKIGDRKPKKVGILISQRSLDKLRKSEIGKRLLKQTKEAIDR
jgi:hypothetical protein